MNAHIFSIYYPGQEGAMKNNDAKTQQDHSSKITLHCTFSEKWTDVLEIFTYSFSEHWLKTYYVSDAVLGDRNTTLKKIE